MTNQRSWDVMRFRRSMLLFLLICTYVYIYLYIYNTYSLLILKFAGGFPYGLEVGSSPRLNFRRKTEVWTLPQKRSPFKTWWGFASGAPKGQDLQRKVNTMGLENPKGKPTEISEERSLGRMWRWRGGGLTRGRGFFFRVEKWVHRSVVFFWLKPTEASPPGN